MLSGSPLQPRLCDPREQHKGAGKLHICRGSQATYVRTKSQAACRDSLLRAATLTIRLVVSWALTASLRLNSRVSLICAGVGANASAIRDLAFSFASVACNAQSGIVSRTRGGELVGKEHDESVSSGAGIVSRQCQKH